MIQKIMLSDYPQARVFAGLYIIDFAKMNVSVGSREYKIGETVELYENSNQYIPPIEVFLIRKEDKYVFKAVLFLSDRCDDMDKLLSTLCSQGVIKEDVKQTVTN